MACTVSTYLMGCNVEHQRGIRIYCWLLGHLFRSRGTDLARNTGCEPKPRHLVKLSPFGELWFGGKYINSTCDYVINMKQW